MTGQVEGGIKVNVSNFNHRDDASKTDFNMFYGKIIDGEKLCFANLESSIKDYVKVMKVDEEARKNVKEEEESTRKKEDGNANENDEITNEAPTVNSSNIFISIQPISSGSASESDEKKEGPILIEANNSDSFLFTLILKDITNDITIITKTQPFPLRWSRWVCGEFQEFADLEENRPQRVGQRLDWRRARVGFRGVGTGVCGEKNGVLNLEVYYSIKPNISQQTQQRGD